MNSPSPISFVSAFFQWPVGPTIPRWPVNQLTPVRFFMAKMPKLRNRWKAIRMSYHWGSSHLTFSSISLLCMNPCCLIGSNLLPQDFGEWIWYIQTWQPKTIIIFNKTFLGFLDEQVVVICQMCEILPENFDFSQRHPDINRYSGSSSSLYLSKDQQNQSVINGSSYKSYK